MYSIEVASEESGYLNYSKLNLGDEVPIFNFQVNTINSLQDLQANYSLELTIPATGQNLSALGYPNASVGVKFGEGYISLPHSTFSCRCTVEGLPLFGQNLFLVVNSYSKKEINVQLLGGNYSLFSALKENLVENLELGEIPQNFSTLRSESNYHYYPIARFRNSQIGIGYQNGAGDARSNFPCFSLKNIVEKILKEDFSKINNTTYTISYEGIDTYKMGNVVTFPATFSEIAKDADEQKAGVDFGTVTSMQLYAGGGSSGYKTIVNVVPHAERITGIGFNKKNEYVEGTGDEKVLFKKNNIHYFANFEGTITVICMPATFLVDWNKFYAVGVRIDKNNIGQGGADIFTGTTIQEVVRNVNVKPGDVIDIHYYILLHNGLQGKPRAADGVYTINHNFAVQIFVKEESTFTPFGFSNTVIISKILGFKTCYDMFLAFCQIFGFTVVLDHFNKKLKFIQHAVYQQKARKGVGVTGGVPRSNDWSGKLVIGSDQISFDVSGFGQINIVSFDESMRSSAKTGIFIGQTYRSQSTDIDVLKLPLKAGYTAAANESYFDRDKNAQVGFFALTERGGAEMSFLGGKPFLAQLSDTARTVQYSKGYDSSEWEILSKAYATALTPSEIISSYYVNFAKTFLSPPRTIVAAFNLLSIDIYEFDASAPIFCAELNSYYYVNKISNYVAGKLTEVELIKIEL